ncbi:RNA polymerase sigma factor [Kitasatospora sp. NPDC050543]|uniref:RNA polymerase sigma factor n=1 Tax=Kitasatospora sp. NPDC050543 TaxID=3364054 RepID=UPI003791B3B7
MTPDADFAEYCRANRHRLLARGVFLCGSRCHAEDALQEALIAAMQQWASIRDPDAWITLAMRRKLIDDSRKWRNRLSCPRTDGELPLPASCPTDLRDHVLTVFGALNHLPTRQRQVVDLVTRGLTSQEIATCLGMSDSTVRSNLRYARQKLRELLNIPPEIDSCGDWLDSANGSDPIAARLREAETWLALGLRAQWLAEGGRQ